MNKKMLEKIFEKYAKKSDISGTKSFGFMMLGTMEQLEILKEGKGRDIIYDYSEIPEGACGEPGWKYSGKIAPDFNWNKLWNSVFDFSWEDFIEKLEKD